MKAPTDKQFADAVKELLAERGLNQRALALRAGVSQSHLSRLLRRADYRVRPSLQLMRSIESALDLPEDYFVEAREAVIVARLRSDPAFREAVYRQAAKASDGSYG